MMSDMNTKRDGAESADLLLLLLPLEYSNNPFFAVLIYFKMNSREKKNL
jgi:hypothetical protein